MYTCSRVAQMSYHRLGSRLYASTGLWSEEGDEPEAVCWSKHLVFRDDQGEEAHVVLATVAGQGTMLWVDQGEGYVGKGPLPTPYVHLEILFGNYTYATDEEQPRVDRLPDEVAIVCQWLRSRRQAK